MLYVVYEERMRLIDGSWSDGIKSVQTFDGDYAYEDADIFARECSPPGFHAVILGKFNNPAAVLNAYPGIALPDTNKPTVNSR